MDATQLLALMQARVLAEDGFERDALTALVEGVLKAETARRQAGRMPGWMRVMEAVLKALGDGRLHLPHKLDAQDGEVLLCVRMTDVVDWVRVNHADDVARRLGPGERTGRDLRRALMAVGALVAVEGKPATVERTIAGQRVGHLSMVRLDRLGELGLEVPGAGGEADDV